MRYLNFTSNNGRQHNGRKERLVLAIDASPSMEDDDWPPTRLLAAIEAAIAPHRQRGETSTVSLLDADVP